MSSTSIMATVPSEDVAMSDNKGDIIVTGNTDAQHSEILCFLMDKRGQ